LEPDGQAEVFISLATGCNSLSRQPKRVRGRVRWLQGVPGL